MSKLRVGVIGSGSIAQAGHLPHYAVHPDVELVAMADLDIERATVVAQKFGVEKVYGDATEMFKHEQLDAVSICTLNSSHVPLAVLAIENGAHVLVEKPLATSVQDAERIVQIAKLKGKICMVGMTHRFRNDARVVKRFVDAGELGDVYYTKARILRRRGTPSGWFTDKSKSGGGPLMDIGVHALDLAWWMIGSPEPATVSGQLVQGIGRYKTLMTSRWKSSDHANQDNSVFDVEDFASAYIRFESGMVLHLEVSWALNGPEDDAIKVDIFGTKGGISLDPLRYYSEQNQVLIESKLDVQPNNQFAEEISHFIESARTGIEPLITTSEGFEVIRMLDAITRSSEKRGEVVIDPQSFAK